MSGNDVCLFHLSVNKFSTRPLFLNNGGKAKEKIGYPKYLRKIAGIGQNRSCVFVADLVQNNHRNLEFSLYTLILVYREKSLALIYYFAIFFLYKRVFKVNCFIFTNLYNF